MASDDKQSPVSFISLGDEPGPARPLTSDRAEALARAVVRQARGNRPRRFVWPAQLAASIGLGLALAGGATAAMTTYLLTREPEPVAMPASSEDDAHAQPQRQPVRAARRAPEEAPPPEKVDEKVETAQQTLPQPPAANKDDRATAGALLTRANRLRAAGQFVQAERLYTRAMHEAQDTDEACVAAVAAAGLRLDHTGAPHAALGLYRRALRMQPSGPLSASARYGIAESHRALGQHEAEARALEDLVAHHPSHLLRARAEARLRELGATH